jgi:hypothetical protein
MQPNCGSAVFTGVQANYTWTDTIGMPGSGSDYFQVTFTDAAGKEPQISDIVIFMNFNGKADCTCVGSASPVSGDPAQTADSVGQVRAGDPIDIGTGNVSYHVTDYSTAGQNPLAFIRTYNSNASITAFAQSAGSNWRSNYDRYVDTVSPNTVNIERANGKILSFLLNGGTWTPDTDVDVSLIQFGTTWKLTDENDTIETYVTRTLPLAGGFLAAGPNAHVMPKAFMAAVIGSEKNTGSTRSTMSPETSRKFRLFSSGISAFRAPLSIATCNGSARDRIGLMLP